MRKVLVVAVREYQAAVRTKAFILSMVMMPIFMGGSILVQRLMREKVDVTDKRFAVYDATGQLFDVIVEAAKRRNISSVQQGGIFKGQGAHRKQVRPRFLIERADVTSNDLDRVALELSEQVRNKKILGFLIIGPDAIHPEPAGQEASIAYYSNSPNYDDFRQWVANLLNERIRSLRLAQADLDPQLVERLTSYVSVASLGLVTVDESGAIQPAKETNRALSMMLPFGMMMLMFMIIMIGAQPLIQSVLEEKMQRIAEVLLGCIQPFQLMMGKLLGTVGVSMTIATVYLVGAFVALRRTGLAEFLPADLVGWFVVYQVLAVLLYGSIFIAVGAAVSDLKEAQSLLTPVMLIVVAPMFVWFNVVREPLSSTSTAMSLFPPATPMLMILRMAVPPGVPLWQPILGAVLVLAMTLLCVFAAGRIFRVGILMQGKGANLREMFRWALRG